MNEDILLAIDGLNVSYGDFQALHQHIHAVPKGAIISITAQTGRASPPAQRVMGVNKPRGGKVLFEGRTSQASAQRVVSKGISLSPEGSSVFDSDSLRKSGFGWFLPVRARENKNGWINL
jgi:ABC-type branched-subunit amino acid transport system ATPase component